MSDSKPKETAYIYQCHYCVAEFGEVYVVVEADDTLEATKKIDAWCKENYCVDSTSGSGYPPPSLLSKSILVK